MIQFVIRRLILIIPTLLGLSILTFTISYVIPADPAALVAGQDATAEMIERVREEYGLNDPFYVQYFRYVGGLLQGDLGESIRTRRAVSEDLIRFLPATGELVLASMAIAIGVGIPLGVIAAIYQNRWPDHLSRATAISFVSLPRFWFGIVLQLIVAVGFGLLPVSGRLPTLVERPQQLTGFFTVDSLLQGDPSLFWLSTQHLLLPAFVQSVAALAIITRTVRGEMLEVLRQDYVTTARAKGLRNQKVNFNHALRNAMIPTLTMVGLSFGYSLGGSVLVEAVFDWPGIGLYAVRSVMDADFAPIMGVTLVVGLAFILINLVVDVLYGVIDPRIRYS